MYIDKIYTYKLWHTQISVSSVRAILNKFELKNKEMVANEKLLKSYSSFFDSKQCGFYACN